MRVDYLIIGSGLTGATIARTLVDANRDVLVVERRPHIGGNVHDHCHPSGISIHTYGPHYFRTTSDSIWDFVRRFADFYLYEACLKTLVDGKHENWPIASTYIRNTIGESWRPAFTGAAKDFEQASLAMMPAPIYEKFVKGYTEKQWGVPAATLSAGLAKRFDVRPDDEPRLMRHKYQGLPYAGYTAFMRNLLRGIPVLLNYEYLSNRHDLVPGKLLVFTGPIDEFFQFRLGRLKYRGQRRIHEYFPDVAFMLPCGQVNNPDPAGGAHIRTLEWKHMMPPEYAARIRGTVLTREIPESPQDPDSYEYPFPDDSNAALYKAYRNMADCLPNTIICGRLGEYRYYDMDQAIGRALMIARRIVKAGVRRSTARVTNTLSAASTASI